MPRAKLVKPLLLCLLGCVGSSSDPATAADARPTAEGGLDGGSDAGRPDGAAGTTWVIEVLAFNIHGLVADSGQYQAIGEVLAGRRQQGDQPDLVLLQEAFGDIADPLRAAAGYPHEVHYRLTWR